MSNYKLIICDKIESGEHKYQIILSKDGIEKIIKEGFYINNLKYYPVFNGIDFEKLAKKENKDNLYYELFGSPVVQNLLFA